MNVNRCQVYPNWLGKMTGDENRGPIRFGMVEENQAMQRLGAAGNFAAVTREENGEVRFYYFTATPENSLFPNNPLWIGPCQALSEEIVPMDNSDEPTQPERRTCPECGADIINDGGSCFYCETKPEGA